ncbi:hypothetical protein B0H11DRAFT_1124509 [Mycena galericulata]|nr:hypothetical protein B0H11DRAFT_1124509 [Mycena galericulata]
MLSRGDPSFHSDSVLEQTTQPWDPRDESKAQLSSTLASGFYLCSVRNSECCAITLESEGRPRTNWSPWPRDYISHQSCATVPAKRRRRKSAYRNKMHQVSPIQPILPRVCTTDLRCFNYFVRTREYLSLAAFRNPECLCLLALSSNAPIVLGLL